MSSPLADPVIAVYMDGTAVSHPEFKDVTVTPNEYVIRFYEGHIITEPVDPDCSAKALFGIGREQGTPKEMKALIVTKRALDITVPVQCESREGYAVTACLGYRMSVNPVDSIRLVRLMGRRLRIAGKLKVSLSGHYNMLVRDDLTDLLTNHLQDIFVQNHAVSKYTDEEISGSRESIEADIRTLLEKEIEDGYWLEQYGFTMTVTSVNIDKTDLQRIKDDLKREEDYQQIRMIREAQLLNSKERQEENRHALEELILKNTLEETRMRVDIRQSESEWRRREYNEYLRRKDIEAQHALDRQRNEDEMKVKLAERLSELKKIDRTNEIEYRQKLAEIEKLRLDSEMKLSQTMMIQLKGIMESVDIARGDARPAQRLCPACGRELQDSRGVCKFCGETIDVQISRRLLDIDQQLSAARRRRDLILGQLLELDTQDELDLETQITRRLTESLTHDRKITLSISPEGERPVTIPVHCFATIFKQEIDGDKKIIVASDDQSTSLPENWGKLPIQNTPFHIFYVRNNIYLYVEEDRKHPEARNKYICHNGTGMKVEKYHQLARGDRLVVNSKYTITID